MQTAILIRTSILDLLVFSIAGVAATLSGGKKSLIVAITLLKYLIEINR